MPIYFSCFITALLLVSGDPNSHNLPQSGRLFILRVMAMLCQSNQKEYRHTPPAVRVCRIPDSRAGGFALSSDILHSHVLDWPLSFCPPQHGATRLKGHEILPPNGNGSISVCLAPFPCGGPAAPMQPLQLRLRPSASRNIHAIHFPADQCWKPKTHDSSQGERR